METHMTNRRRFLRTLAGATAGAVTLGRGFDPLQAQARRQVSVGGHRIKVIDIHCHGAIDVTEVVKGTPLANAARVGNQILGPPRLQLMDQQGVDVQALTINGFWWYAAEDRELAGRKIGRASCRERVES